MMNNTKKALSVLVIAILFVGTIVGVAFYYNGIVNEKNSQTANLENEAAEHKNEISNLTDQISDLQRQMAFGLIQGASGYYLPRGIQQPDYQGSSRILVLSANATYGHFPYNITRLNGQVVGVIGQPCVLVNVTIRNDYSSQNLPPLHDGNSTSVYVRLTALLFNGETQIDTTDLLHVGLPPSAATEVWVPGGESAMATIYLAPDNWNITSFQIVPLSISGIPIP